MHFSLPYSFSFLVSSTYAPVICNRVRGLEKIMGKDVCKLANYSLMKQLTITMNATNLSVIVFFTLGLY
jgi:hypothetical protein